ncbi:MAG TPA: hypothetical protein VGR66_06455 [Candidatus Eisenbacteria bacterium]|nr:hypothetical protein [Candidatus Eisenbacteria bacterium]
MARCLWCALTAAALLAGCASSPGRVVYVERSYPPYPPPPPRVVYVEAARPAWRQCGPPAYSVHPPRTPARPHRRPPPGHAPARMGSVRRGERPS